MREGLRLLGLRAVMSFRALFQSCGVAPWHDRRGPIGAATGSRCGLSSLCWQTGNDGDELAGQVHVSRIGHGSGLVLRPRYDTKTSSAQGGSRRALVTANARRAWDAEASPA